MRGCLVAALLGALSACTQSRPVETWKPLPDPVVHPIEVDPASPSTPTPPTPPTIGSVLERTGDEIMIAGQLVHTGAPVVLWFDPGGYDAYRVTKRFASPEQRSWDASKGSIESPNRYSDRPGKPADGWTPDSLAGVVDQFVMHYDAAGVSRSCFRVLHDIRGLSIHFMLDLDGTIYQTLDVKERAWHATIANDRSVGIEIANIGAYPAGQTATLDSWYTTDSVGTRVTLPGWLGGGGLPDPNVVHRPARSEPVRGEVNGTRLVQYDLTEAQYESLARLTAALCVALPKIQPEVPRDASGLVRNGVLTSGEFGAFSGVLGHSHVQSNKIDPGPAFDWERVLRETRAHLGGEPGTSSSLD